MAATQSLPESGPMAASVMPRVRRGQRLWISITGNSSGEACETSRSEVVSGGRVPRVAREPGVN